LPRSPQWTDLHEILHWGSSRRRNHLFQILCQSVEGFRICAGSNFAILPLLSRSPLTPGGATAQPVMVCSMQVAYEFTGNFFSSSCNLFMFKKLVKQNIIMLTVRLLIEAFAFY